MKRPLYLAIAIMLFMNTFSCAQKQKSTANPDVFYAFTATSLQGKDISMSDYRGKLILIVNTASKCGFTPQFEGLQALYEKYKNQGLVILGFPCNQFLNQEPGDETSIAEGCVINYGVTFPMFSKIDVKGSNAHPIFNYLTTTTGESIKWNFNKFLIDKKGNIIDYFGSKITPAELDPIIADILKQ